MNVLVIGGTGYIGTHAVEELLRRGHEVTVFARGETVARLPAETRFIQGDRHQPADLAALRTARFDAVVDINAYTREETQAAINTFDERVTRFVHLSSLSACQYVPAQPFNESSPLVTDPSFTYGYNKAECERALRWAHARNGFPFVSLRPPAVIGPRDHQSRENYFLKRMVAGHPVIVAGSGATPIWVVYVKDLAATLANALTATDVEGGAYAIAQAEPVSINDHIAAIAAIAGVEADVEHIPARLLERLGFNLQHFPYFSGDAILTVDASAARDGLGFKPTPYQQALKETVHDLLDRGPERCPSIEDRYPPLMPRAREGLLVARYRAARRDLEDRLTDEWLNEALPKE
ncbi:MAG TPA: NAD-dependent epimerase/dehydratase family protein [Blastocatellia bacterium]|nr:NAD-dependent epimerase/dehydratase family protein [Blastocatellia bacterium]